MKTTSNNKFFITAIMLFALVGMPSMAFVNYTQDEKKKPWVVPEKSKAMKNPVKANDESIKAGKILYSKHCKSCHGVKGLGDGPKAKELKTPSGDLSVDLKEQTDGEIYYKIKEGRDDMPSFKKKIPDDNDIWTLVNYVRTLAGDGEKKK